MEIMNLKDKPKLIDKVIDSMWKEWGNEKNRITYERFVKNIVQSEQDIPQIFISTEGNKLTGFVALLRNDLTCRQDLFPWFGCLYINKDYRGKGISRLLEKHACNKAKELGFNKLYLISLLEDYYEKLGWKYMCSEPRGTGEMTKVYEKEL